MDHLKKPWSKKYSELFYFFRLAALTENVMINIDLEQMSVNIQFMLASHNSYSAEKLWVIRNVGVCG